MFSFGGWYSKNIAQIARSQCFYVIHISGNIETEFRVCVLLLGVSLSLWLPSVLL